MGKFKLRSITQTQHLLRGLGKTQEKPNQVRYRVSLSYYELERIR